MRYFMHDTTPARISHQASSRNVEDACGCKAREERTTQAYETVCWGGRASATPQTRAYSALQQVAG